MSKERIKRVSPSLLLSRLLPDGKAMFIPDELQERFEGSLAIHVWSRSDPSAVSATSLRRRIECSCCAETRSVMCVALPMQNPPFGVKYRPMVSLMECRVNFPFHDDQRTIVMFLKHCF